MNPNRMVHFIEVVLGRASLHVPPEQSLAVQGILDAIYGSAATGREVRLAGLPATYARASRKARVSSSS